MVMPRGEKKATDRLVASAVSRSREELCLRSKAAASDASVRSAYEMLRGFTTF